jgi:hypothetical protein
MRTPRPLTDEQLCAIVGFRAEGFSYKKIAELTGVVAWKVASVLFALKHPTLNLQQSVVKRFNELMKE